MVDFSDAEENGLREALGDDYINSKLHGCEFHFKQSVNKVAKLVTETELPEKMFHAIANLIPSCEDETKVRLYFSVLGGMEPVSSIKDNLSNPELRERSEEVRNESWKGASTWIDWWLRPNHLAKVSLAFSGKHFSISTNDRLSLLFPTPRLAEIFCTLVSQVTLYES